MSYSIDVIRDADGNIIRPATITDNVINPKTAKNVTEELGDLTSMFQNVNKDGYFVTDSSGNVGLQYTSDGLDAAVLSLHFIKLLKDAGFYSGNIGIDVVEDGFFFIDESLNIGVKIDNDGIHAKNILEYEIVEL